MEEEWEFPFPLVLLDSIKMDSSVILSVEMDTMVLVPSAGKTVLQISKTLELTV